MLRELPLDCSGSLCSAAINNLINSSFVRLVLLLFSVVSFSLSDDDDDGSAGKCIEIYRGYSFNTFIRREQLV